ncbi:MAG: FG-GAP-like repeat-containing protein [Planctomycetota bacterium]
MRSVSALTAILFLGCPTLAAQIHVSTTGNDTTGDGSVGNPYLTITRAMTGAPAGSTIQLGAGTFGLAEQVEFTTTPFTLVGAGMGTTILKPHATAIRQYPAGLLPGTLEDHRVALAVNGPARVDVRDLTIDCDFNFTGFGTGRLYGIYLRDGGDATFSNVEVKNARTNPLNGIQGPVAVVARGDNAGDPCEITMRGCYVHDWGKNGFVANFNAFATLEGNEFVGSGQTPVIAQNCVQISRGSTGIVRGNVIKDSFYTPASVTSTGVLFFDAGPGCVLEGNSVNRCQSGIYVYQSAPANVPVAVRDNKVTESTWGLDLIGNWGGLVTGNVIHGATDEAAYDNSTGANTNTWTSNNFSDWTGAGTYAVPGGSVVDPTPRRSFDDLGLAFTVAVGGVPNDLVVADLDLSGPSSLDFATVNDPASFGAAPSVSVAINTGFPTYAVQTLSFGVAGDQPVGICVGQFDGAAGLDLAVVTTNSKWFVFGNDGLGTFSVLANGTLPAAALSPNDVACGDLDGDGRADLVVATLNLLTPGGGFVLLNDGTGTAFTGSALAGAFSAGCKGVAVGDLDGASGLDIALTEGNGSFGLVHLYAGDGTGAFTAMSASPLTVDTDPTSVAIFDVDADGKNDLAVTSTKAVLPLAPGSATLLRNQLPAGFAATAHDVGAGPQGVAFGDLGNDGDPDSVRRDAVVANFATGNVSVLSSWGRGGFAGNFTALAGTTPRAVALAGMDGDVLGDLVVADAASSNVRILVGVHTARGDLYGQGCPGTFGRVPQISTSGAPAIARQPNLSFGIQVTNARPLSVGVLAASGAPGPLLTPCSFLLASTDVVWVQFTNAFGAANVGIPLPPAPSLAGAIVYFQWAIIDPAGQFVGTFALSEGLKVRVGL